MQPATTVVDFPLRGEWVAYHTPADRVPTHGTNDFAQRYAYDFVRIDHRRPGWKFFDASEWQYYLYGVPLKNFYAWGQPLHAPFDATVHSTLDGWPERNPVHFINDLVMTTRDVSSVFFVKQKRWVALAGNHVILKMHGHDIYAAVAHIRTGSVCVHKGQEIRSGEQIGEVGHSGASSAPHLHFQLMDGPDPVSAKGLRCSFRAYEVFSSGSWSSVADGVPAKRQRIRFGTG